MHNLVLLQNSAQLTVGSRTAETSSVLTIWDFISGTSDERPFNEAYAEKVLGLLRTSCPGAPRVLDLGGGAGNPSIALTRAGCNVTLIDKDEQLLGAARERSRSAGVELRCELEDWRDFLVRQIDEAARYDAVLFLGNALGYQDSWPDKDVPRRRPADSIAPTLDLCRRVLAPGGVVVVEAPFEPVSESRDVYVRFHPPLAEGGALSTTSVWVVSYDEEGASREVDTMIVVPAEGGVSRVKERVKFSGWLLTRARLGEAAEAAGLRAEFDPPPFRSMFEVALLRA
jgi:SAM-dependent methyltransferase